jgi:hypothetical protein
MHSTESWQSICRGLYVTAGVVAIFHLTPMADKGRALAYAFGVLVFVVSPGIVRPLVAPYLAKASTRKEPQ